MFDATILVATADAGSDAAVFWYGVTLGGYLLTLLLTPWVFLQKKPHPESTLAWIMAIILLPYLGSLLFLIFGINRVARRAARKQAANRRLGGVLPGLSQYQLIPGEEPSPQLQRLMRLTDRLQIDRPCYGNQVEVLVDTNRALGLIEQAILSAQHSVNLEYYIWQPDRTGRKLRDLLIDRAKQGVQIRFLYDGIGSLWLGRRFLAPMRAAGIRVASFLPGPTFRERWSINLRSHRKIVIVDGKTGFTGGMNIGDEYIGKNRYLGYWRDTHLCLGGPVVLQLQQVFAEDWFFATSEMLSHAEWYPPPQELGDQLAHVVAGGPDQDTDVFHTLLFAALNEAVERITITTGYFIPTPALQTALETAAARGVQVRLLLPAHGGHRWMVTAGRSFYDQLLEAGIEIYEYQHRALHAKTVTIDGLWSLVGTPNFDTRSLRLNFEVAVILYGPKPAERLENNFTADLKHAQRIEPATWSQRSSGKRLAEQFLRLFSPVL